jgi:hypothetical protein
MLDAVNAQVINNRLGDSLSDSVEILTGPGIISGNYAEIDDVTGYVLSTDAADYVNITNNVIVVLPSGIVSQSVIRTWGGRVSHVISNNQIRIEGRAASMLEVRGYLNVITGNLFNNNNFNAPLSRIEVNGASLIHDNLMKNADVILTNTSDWPSSFADNLLLFGTTVAVVDDAIFGTPPFVKFEL